MESFQNVMPFFIDILELLNFFHQLMMNLGIINCDVSFYFHIEDVVRIT